MEINSNITLDLSNDSDLFSNLSNAIISIMPIFVNFEISTAHKILFIY